MMKIKSSFALLSFISVVIITSCDDNTKTTGIQTSDTTSVNIPEELKQLNAQLLADPNNAMLYHQRAKYYFNTKNFQEGLNDISKAVSIDSTKAEYFITLSDLNFVINRTGIAKTALEKALQLDNKNIDAMLKLAELYLYVSKNDKSIEYANMALKINDYNAKAYFIKGMNYKDIKDTARAISSMQTAVEQDQQHYHAYMQLGLLCAAKKNPLAVQYYKNAMRIQPQSIETWYDIGKYYQDVEDYNNALAAYTTLLKIDPQNKYAHYNMGAIHLINLKKYEIAINHFTNAIKVDPKYVEAYYGRGISYQGLNNKTKALIDFQACQAINPRYEPAQIKLQQLNGEK